MSTRRRPWNFTAAILLLLPLLAARSACADSRIAASRGTEAVDEVLLTLSRDCVLSSFRLPGLMAVASFDAGGCDANTVAPVPGRQAVAVVGRDGGQRAALLLLALPHLETIATQEISPGISSLLAPSGGPFLVAVDSGKNLLRIFDRDTLAQLRQVPMHDRLGRPLTFSRMIESASRRSVIVAFAEAELWELFLAADAEPVFEGLVHDYRMGEGLREPRQLPIRRIGLDGPVDSFFVEANSPNLVLSRRNRGGSRQLLRLNLDVRRVVAIAQLNPLVADISGAIPAGGQPGAWLVADGDGVQVISIVELPAPRRITSTEGDCRIAATRSAKWMLLHACRNEGHAQIFVMDLITLSVKALLQPSAGNATTHAIESRDARHLFAVVPGDAGAVVRYRTGDWCRVDQLAVAGLKDAWIYPW